MQMKPVIVVVAYNRLSTIIRLLKFVSEARYDLDDVTLIISIDYHKDNSKIIEYANEFEWNHGNKIVSTHKENLGLKRHVIECGDYAIKYGAAIVLEDDQIVTPSFYSYACDVMNYYLDDGRVAGISLYAHEWNGYACKKFQPLDLDGDVYFGQFQCSRGQAWTSSQWSHFKKWYAQNPEITEDELMPRIIYGWNKSWGKYFGRYLVENNKYFVMPKRPFSTVFGEPGENTTQQELDVQISLYWGNRQMEFIPFDKGVHYDLFFENIELKKFISDKYEIPEDSVCVDIYACSNREYKNKRYVLTTRRLRKKVVASFGLSMRPQEMNVYLDVPGNCIFLYDLNEKADTKLKAMGRLEYDFAGVHGMEAVRYGASHICGVIISILKRQIK